MVGRGSGSAAQAQQRDYAHPIFRLRRLQTAEPRPGTYHHLGTGDVFKLAPKSVVPRTVDCSSRWGCAAPRKQLGKRIGLATTTASAQLRYFGQICGRSGASPHHSN
jgi:hypothetical protein